jgi:hypothetical protein
MPRPAKIVQLGLERQAIAARNAGMTGREARDRLNAILKRRGEVKSVTDRAVERYWATLDGASIAPSHQPQLAERNADLAINIGGNLSELSECVRGWFEEAKEARVTRVVKGNDEPEAVDCGPDWPVRLNTAREFRKLLRFSADILERIYNIENIRVFQETVLEAVGEASPEVQREIKRRFEGKREIVRARLLGL